MGADRQILYHTAYERFTNFFLKIKPDVGPNMIMMINLVDRLNQDILNSLLFAHPFRDWSKIAFQNGRVSIYRVLPELG